MFSCYARAERSKGVRTRAAGQPVEVAHHDDNTCNESRPSAATNYGCSWRAVYVPPT